MSTTLDLFATPLDGINLIEASAGTGKTWTICGLYVRLLLETPRTVPEILVVTFTKAATVEIRDRIRNRLVDLERALEGGAAGDADPFVVEYLRYLDGGRIAGLDAQGALARIKRSLSELDEVPFAAGMPFSVEALEDDEEFLLGVATDFFRSRIATDAIGPHVASLLRGQVTPACLAAVLKQRLAKPLAHYEFAFGSDPASLDRYVETYLEARGLWRAESKGIVQCVIDGLSALSRGGPLWGPCRAPVFQAQGRKTGGAMMKPKMPSVWWQASFGLAAWLWLAPGADALPTYTPIPLDLPNPQANARFAEAVAGIGDVNGDGASDFVVGAPSFQVLGNLNQGRVFVFSGTDRSPLLTLDSPIPQQGLALFGSAVAGIGDVNGDGRPDLLVGAPRQTVGGRANQGQAYVLSGADGRLLLTLDNPIPQADAAFGAAVAGIGDVNGDGRPDLLVGAPEQDVRGQAFVFSGADGRLLFTLVPPSTFSAAFGRAVAGAGDVNGDGAPDVLVAAFVGRAFVFSGGDGSVLRILSDPQNPQGSLDGPVAGVGDVNGDGAPDLLVGVPHRDVGGEAFQGRAFVFSGADASLIRLLDNPVPQRL